MLTVEQIIAVLDTDRDSFAQAFEQAQTRASVDAKVSFNAITIDMVDSEAFKKALKYSEEKGFFKELCSRIMFMELDKGALFSLLMEKGSDEEKGNAELQAMVNELKNFDYPLEISRGISKGIRFTAKIVIDENKFGSGVLVNPDLILTSWHVVRDLFEISESGEYKPIDNIEDRIRIEFDDFTEVLDKPSMLGATKKRSYKVANRWCLSYSGCHSEEINEKLPANLEHLDGFWDYVLLKLEDSPGYERDWAKMNASTSVPIAPDTVFVFQHPAGAGLRVAYDSITVPDPNHPTAIPSLRFVHAANTLKGSSGGPCFSKSFKLFGIHQGLYAEVMPKILNRGVPLNKILAHMDLSGFQINERDMPAKPLWRIADAQKFTPVIGCDDFVKLILDCVNRDTALILTINGHQGTGKTFRTEILRSILPASSHIVVDLPGPSIAKKSALETAVIIAQRVGENIPLFTRIEDINSSGSVWIKSYLIPELMTIIEQKRNQKNVWFSIIDLNQTQIDGELCSDFLYAFYEQVTLYSWLRIVLDGMKTGLVHAVRDYQISCSSSEIRLDDIKDFFYRFSTETKRNFDLGTLNTLVDLADDIYRDGLNYSPENAVVKLIEEVRRIFRVTYKVQ